MRHILRSALHSLALLVADRTDDLMGIADAAGVAVPYIPAELDEVQIAAAIRYGLMGDEDWHEWRRELDYSEGETT